MIIILKEYIEKCNINDFDIDKVREYSNDAFITKNSRDIPRLYIQYAEQNLDRVEAVSKIFKLLMDMGKSVMIEKSIYEFSLIHAFTNNLCVSIIVAVYEDKLDDILDNLNPKSRIRNETLCAAIINGTMSPKMVAFLSPHQMHPQSWIKILDKIKYREDVETNIATTDIYQCSRCKERKCKITQLQTRCADEPVTKFITCTVCYHTFIIT